MELARKKVGDPSAVDWVNAPRVIGGEADFAHGAMFSKNGKGFLAHPTFRESLEREAHEAGFLRG